MTRSSALSMFVRSVLTLLLSLLLLLTPAILKAQEAYKVAEVENPRCDLSEVPQIDPPPYGKFATILNSTPGARGAIVVFGLEGSATRYAQRVKDRLINFAGVAADPLVTIYGGHSESERMELWILPQGAAEHRFDYIEDAKRAQKFDIYSYWSGEYCGSERLPALTVFAETLKRKVGWRGYIIVHPHRNRRGSSAVDEGWDPDGNLTRRQALGRAVRDKSYLVEKFGLERARLKALVGVSDDEWTHAELWLVPPGAEPLLTRAATILKQR